MTICFSRSQNFFHPIALICAGSNINGTQTHKTKELYDENREKKREPATTANK